MVDDVDDVLAEVLRLARDPSVADVDLQARVRDVLERLPAEQRDAAIERARELLAEHRGLH